MKEQKANWRDKTACGGVEGFTEKDEPEQKKWCRSCKVTAECLSFALDNEVINSSNTLHGWPVYGGMNAVDRQTILRRRAAAKKTS